MTTAAGGAGKAPLTGTRLSELRGVRLADGHLATVRLDGGRVREVTSDVSPAGNGAHPTPGVTSQGESDISPREGEGYLSPREGEGYLSPREGDGHDAVVLDATGWRLLPAASEPHAHLDKALTASRIPPGSGNDLVAAITQWRTMLPRIDAEDIHDRARAALARYVARGITAVRTHVDAPTSGDALRGVEALVRLRDEVAGSVTLQVWLLAGSEVPDPVIDEAVALGIDLVGGCPHLAPDPRHETTRLLDAAQRHGLPVDLHTDEQTDAREVDLAHLAEEVLARGMAHRVTASHCVRLGSLPPERLAPVLEAVRRAGIGIVSLPITNLYLQGWEATHLAPRGLTAARQILDAGIPFAAGADNLRDPFNPVGRADPFETTSLLVTAAHLTPEEALAAVTTGARAVLGLPPAGAVPGADADFLLVPDGDLGDVVAGHEDTRVVVHAGRVVADTRVHRSVDLSPSVDLSGAPALTATTVR